MKDFLLASGHHLALFLLLVAVATEAAYLRLEPSASLVERLAKVDAWYGLAAGLLLGLGLWRVFGGAKPALFYANNWVFVAKVSVYVVLGLISIIPTVRYIRWRKALRAGGALPSAQAWQSTRRLVLVQLHTIPLLAIAAAAMARGIGY